MQSHENRSEVWVVLKGEADTLVGNETKILKRGGILKIGKKQKHRLAGIKDSYILEMAYGSPRERDIIRHEDDYGRAT